MKNKFRVSVRKERCKGCGLCATVCPKKVFVMSTTANGAGYFFAEPVNQENCIGCEKCCVMCGDVCIEIKQEID